MSLPYPSGLHATSFADTACATVATCKLRSLLANKSANLEDDLQVMFGNICLADATMDGRLSSSLIRV